MRNAFLFSCCAALVAASLCASPAQGARRFSTVVIDAGHGGFDRGGIPGQRVAESVMALDVAQRLQRDLQRAGYRTIMTRDRDVFVPLPERVAIANAQRDAVFVCVHFNSATRSGANGIETYYYSGDSDALASSIHSHVAGGAPSENRGVRRRGFYVLRRTNIPAVLVECGFLTNPVEARLAQTAAYRQQLADEIARGVSGTRSLESRPSLIAAEDLPTRRAVVVHRETTIDDRATSRYTDANGTRYLDAAEYADRVTSSATQPRSSAEKAPAKHTSHASHSTHRTHGVATHRKTSRRIVHKKKPARRTASQ